MPRRSPGPCRFGKRFEGPKGGSGYGAFGQEANQLGVDPGTGHREQALRTAPMPAGSPAAGRRSRHRPAAACNCYAPAASARRTAGTRPSRHTPLPARARAQMHNRPPVSAAVSTTTPARCGSSRSRLISCWPDQHPLTCGNDTADSWEDGWTRQPPIYQVYLGDTRITSQNRLRGPHLMSDPLCKL
jgi:hypothetical protein